MQHNTKPRKILVVEDSEDDAELEMSLLSSNGVKPLWRRVDTEPAMRESLEAEHWDLVISDYNMPTFSGLEAIKTRKKSGKEIPLIIVSGTIGEEVAIEIMKAGATDYVLKNNLSRLPMVTERALHEFQIEREKREIERRLIDSQKMDAIGKLAGGVAHDVNGMLTAVRLFVELATDQIQGGNLVAAKDSLQGILKAQVSAAAIIRQILTFSRRRTRALEVLDFASVVLGMRSLIENLVGNDIIVSLHHLSMPQTVLADRTELEQVVMNLAINARDAMPHGGLLDLKFESKDLETIPSGVRIPIQPGHYVVLTVHDTGTGMSEEIKERLFEPFFTTKDEGKGTGLGLSMVYGILQSAGGSISVESATGGGGTTFRVYWPWIQ